MNGEKGQALPMAILALTIGALVIAPFLGHAGSSLIGSRVYGESIGQQNACDAGVEHAIWNLTNGGLAEQFTEPGDEVTYQLYETINGLTTSVTVTANATGGGSFAGDINDTVIDSLEFDKSNGYEPSIVHVSGDVYAIAYRGPGSDGFVKTISIDHSGEITNSVIDSLEFDTSNGYEPCIVHVAGNIYAIAYRGSGSDGFLKTVSIDASGNIGNWVIDSLEYDTSNGYQPSIINVSGGIFAIAYRGPGNDGFVKTVSIDANGNIGNWIIDSLEYDRSRSINPDMIQVSVDVYAIAYRGPGSDGFVKTVSIDASGNIGNSVIDSLEFDTSNGYQPGIIRVYNTIYAIAYRGSGSDGFLKTVSIDASGNIGNSVIDSLEYNTTDSYDPRPVYVSDSIYAIAYRGTGNDGFLKTVSIDANGDIVNSVVDTLEFDTSSGYQPGIINVSGGIFAIAYRGPGNDGFVKTVEIASAGASAAYTIVATAGDRTIRAFINTDNATVSIVLWQIE